jgi:hypothetical protein
VQVLLRFYELLRLSELPLALASGELNQKAKALAEIYLLIFLLASASFQLKQ